MRIFLPLLLVLCATPVLSIFKGTCLRKEPALGVLVLAPGSGLFVTCGGHVEVDGVKVRMGRISFNNEGREISAITTPVNIRNNAEEVSSKSDKQTTWNADHTGLGVHTRTRESSPSTTNTVKPTIVSQPVEGESDWKAEEMDGEGDYEEEEEGSRVTRGLPSRPQWKWNGGTVGKVERDWGGMTFARRGAALSLSSVRLTDSGNYACYYRGREKFALKVTVAEPLENPGLSCYKRSPSSKIRCEGETQKPLSPRPNCYLLHSTGKAAFLRSQCSYSSRLSRCWCTLDYNEDELRTIHTAYLCVTSIAGNATSALLHFTPLSILKPDPPSNVSAQQVEGLGTRLKVSWSFPASWKSQDRFYELTYEIKYKPMFSLYEQVNFIRKYRSYTITDAMPGVEYLIQLRTKDEFDGQWSDWSAPVYASSWTVSPTLHSDAFPPVEFPVYSEGSGTDYNVSDVTEVPEPERVSPHVLWIPGSFALLSVILAIYIFRHREKLLWKLQSLCTVTQRGDMSPPPPSAPSAPEVQALVTFTPPCYKEPPTRGVEEGEKDTEENQQANKGMEAKHFNNTSYFLLPR